MQLGFYYILCAQFFSSLADNALLIGAIALLSEMSAPEWMTPLLRLFFVISYVLLAAYVGIFADSMPKGRVMLLTNMLKIVGCVCMLTAIHPLLAYAIVGVGAAAYSPAKYGILTELLPPEKLVIANSWMEGLTVGSIIVGVMLGGIFVHPKTTALILSSPLPLEALGLTSPAQVAIALVIVIYAIAAAVNLLIPDTHAKYKKVSFRPIKTLANFVNNCSVLWHDKLGQISLSVTTLFWGAGAVLQFLVLTWAHEVLGMDLSQAAILQAVVSIGIAIGAVLAAKYVPLKKSLNVLVMGVVMGATVALTAFFNPAVMPVGGFVIGSFTLTWAILAASLIMVAIGCCAGFFVVPMNALLQHRGYVLMSAGRSIAVQNFNENLSILTMLGLYSLLIKAGMGVTETMFTFGTAVALAMAGVMLKHRYNQKQGDSLHLIGEERHSDAV